MLSRDSGDSGSRLIRSKSSASVEHRSREPAIPSRIDPEIAQRHAMIAAHIAMDRAQQRSSLDTNVSTDLSRSHSQTSRAGVVNPRLTNIRFQDRKHNTGPAGPRHYTGELSHFPASNSYTHVSNIRNGHALDEFGVAGPHGSTPSSYRKLRKSRSMISPRHRESPGYRFQPQSPSGARALRRARSSIGFHDRNIRLGLKRSMSFLKSGRGNFGSFIRSHNHSTSNETTADLISEYSEGGIENYGSQEHRSATRAKQDDILQRRNSRSKGSGVPGENAKDTSTVSSQTRSDSKLRDLSTSLRDRMRRVLGRSSKDSFLPAQQMHATRAHFRDYLDNADGDHKYEEYFTGNLSSASRSSLYIPSTQHEDGLDDLHTLSRNLRSMHSSDSLRSNGQSRLTSWTNSTITNSAAGRSTPIERKRLSIIQEHGGPHQPSSSIGRHLDEVSVTHLPTGAALGDQSPGTAIDSARVYSALVKRMDQEQEREEERARLRLGKVSQRTRQQQSSSDRDLQPTATIRQVTNDSVYSGTSSEASTSVSRISSFIDRCRLAHQKQTPNDTNGNGKLVLDSTRSSFFPFSNETKVTGPSPLRRALSSRPNRQTTSDDDDEEDNSSVIVRRPTRRENPDTSGSRYSRTPSGRILSSESLALNPELDDLSTGLPAIIPPRVSRLPGFSQSLQNLQKTRATGTDDWKALISSPLDSGNQRPGPGPHHYRESAQIDSDDRAIGIGTSSPTPSYKLPIPESPSPGRPQHEPGSSNYYSYQPRASERFPTLDLKEIPANTASTVRKDKQPKRMTSLIRLASAAADIKRVVQGGLGVDKGDRGVSDENARMSPAGHRVGTERNMQRRESGEIVSTPGRLQVKLESANPKTNTNASQYSTREPTDLNPNTNHPTPPTLAAKPDPTPPSGPRALMLSRLSRPFDLTGLSLGSSPNPTSSGIASSDDSMLHLGETALPRFDGADEKGEKGRDRGRRVGVGVAVSLGRKRMVSDFLRSRRKGSEGRRERERERERQREEEGGLAFI